MSQTKVVITCQSGTKWVAPLSTNSTPDPCPSGQKMTAETITYSEPINDVLDPVAIGASFSSAFVTVLLCFLVARSAGTVLLFLRR